MVFFVRRGGPDAELALPGWRAIAMEVCRGRRMREMGEEGD